jgi:hypothetical protein
MRVGYMVYGCWMLVYFAFLVLDMRVETENEFDCFSALLSLALPRCLRVESAYARLWLVEQRSVR